mmetsp:Transcript_270/g.248  ORF Transcript_270/g.248 Transcript_270/m.248 type:complete len:158 (-) Transcript_270:91-564(-)
MNFTVAGSYYTASDPDAMYTLTTVDQKYCKVYRFDANTAESKDLDMGNCATLGDIAYFKPLLAVNVTRGPSAVFQIDYNNRLLRINHKGYSEVVEYCEYDKFACIPFASIDADNELAYVITITPQLNVGVITQTTYNLSENAANIDTKVLSWVGTIA